jgi:rsbT co-antagonist protein RsbR
MAKVEEISLPIMIERHEKDLLAAWMKALADEGGLRSGRIKEAELRVQCESFLRALHDAIATGGMADINAPSFATVRDLLASISRARAMQGYTPSETAIFVFSLKQQLFAQIGHDYANDPEGLARETWNATTLLDKLGLYTIEAYHKSREEVIRRQQEELAELSTPVVRVWERIVALPLIGTLDSARTQVVMENLLQEIVSAGAEVAIIDITGVPTVDTLVAQHLLKTVEAARLMGADCIISGVRPQIAQTLVHLGVELQVTTKATLAGALAVALDRTGRRIVSKQTA